MREDTMDSGRVIFVTTDGEQSIPVADIVYIESQKNYFVVHCANALSYRCRGTISKVSQQLEPYPFYRVHAAYLINMKNVSQVCGGRSIQMCDGSVIYAGQKRYSSFRKEYLRYTTGKEAPEMPEQTAQPRKKRLGMLLLLIIVLACGLFAVIASATELFAPKPPDASAVPTGKTMRSDGFDQPHPFTEILDFDLLESMEGAVLNLAGGEPGLQLTTEDIAALAARLRSCTVTPKHEPGGDGGADRIIYFQFKKEGGRVERFEMNVIIRGGETCLSVQSDLLHPEWYTGAVSDVRFFLDNSAAEELVRVIDEIGVTIPQR